MLAREGKPVRWSRLLSGVVAAGLLHAAPVLAQSPDQGGSSGSGYRIGESTSEAPVPATAEQADGAQSATAPPADPKVQGPVRMARFAFTSGNVTWRADEGMEWSKATVNLPLRQGAQVWVTDGGRADVQFDDGSELRLGNGAVATLKVLYSDAKGEFTQITMTDGLATLRTRREDSVYQMDTPLVSVKSVGATQIRFGVDMGTEVAIQRGSATVDGTQGKVTLHEGDYLDLANADMPYKAMTAPPADSWDRWNSERNRLIDTKTETSRHLPPNINIAAGDLDQYGAWRNDPKYGWVWVPRTSSPDWRPYSDGNWTWVEPYGWTWVGNEPWGWAPYHYGTWVDQPYGWAWCPGPAYQYWSPGVVGFSVYAGNIGWAPLCPWEVSYPAAFGFGYWGNNWCLSFSIGFAGCYYPWGGGFWRPWNNYYVNHWGHEGFGHGGWGHEGFGHGGHEGSDHFGHGNNNPAFNPDNLVRNHGFVPYNASHVAGATMASTAAFGGHGGYQAVPRTAATNMFTRGQTVGAPAAGRAPLAGPGNVQPTRLAMTPTRSFLANAHPAQSVLQRPVYQAALPASVQRSLPNTMTQRAPGTVTASRTGSGFTTPGSVTQGRAGVSVPNRGPVNAGIARGVDSRVSTAAEAARQARASLGYTGRSTGSGYTSGSGRFGGQGYSGPASGGGYTGRYSGSYGNAGGRTYTPGGSYNGAGNYRPAGGYNGGNRPAGGYNGGGGYRRVESSGGSFGGGRGGGSAAPGGGYRGGGGGGSFGGGGSRGGGGRGR